MSSTFNFTNASSEYLHKIGSNVILHLYRSNHSVAILEFTDEMNNKIPIPTGLVVYTKDHQSNQKVTQPPTNNIYALCWTDDYVIELNHKLVLDIKNSRNWDITLA